MGKKNPDWKCRSETVSIIRYGIFWRFYKKLLELINEVTKAADFMTDIQKSVVFLYIRKEKIFKWH